MWQVRIEVRQFPGHVPVPMSLESVTATGATKLGTFAQAVTMMMGGMRAEMRDLLSALRVLRQIQAGIRPSGPSQDAGGEAPSGKTP